MFLVGIVISKVLDTLVEHEAHIAHPLIHYFISISITILVWEGVLRLDTLFNRSFPWERNPGRRVMVQLPVSVLYSAGIIYLSMVAFNKWVCALPESTEDKFMVTALVIGVLVTLVLLAVEIGAQFFGHWKRSLIEVEKYKAQSLQAQLQNLKDQLNPHFLFNNLSVLSSLVYKDQDKSVDFINQLSKVYRYLLDNRSLELVTLDEELAFMESYSYLLLIRFDTSLSFVKEISPGMGHRLLPPMALQMLVENAIKHNEVGTDAPLAIHITAKNDMLVIKNNLQLRKQEGPTPKTGIQNIRDRYRFFTDREVLVEQNNGSFCVTLPLLLKK